MFEKLITDPSLTAEDEALVRARLERAQRALGALSGEHRGRALALATRRRLGRVKGRLGLGDRWYDILRRLSPRTSGTSRSCDRRRDHPFSISA